MALSYINQDIQNAIDKVLAIENYYAGDDFNIREGYIVANVKTSA